MEPEEMAVKPAKLALPIHQMWTVLGTILCVILVPILCINLTLIVKSYLNQDEVPTVGGFLPLIVLTDSMYPGIQSGDLIVCRTVEPETLNVGDIIAFFDPAGNGTSIVTHRVEGISTENGLSFTTKGDANNVADQLAVPAENVVGLYQSRIAGAGNLALFMQTTTGLVVCVVLPLLLLVGYDLCRRRLYERAQRKDTAALMAELEELRRTTNGQNHS